MHPHHPPPCPTPLSAGRLWLSPLLKHGISQTQRLRQLHPHSIGPLVPVSPSAPAAPVSTPRLTFPVLQLGPRHSFSPQSSCLAQIHPVPTPSNSHPSDTVLPPPPVPPRITTAAACGAWSSLCPPPAPHSTPHPHQRLTPRCTLRGTVPPPHAAQHPQTL